MSADQLSAIELEHRLARLEKMLLDTQSKLAIAIEALEFVANDGYSSTSEDGIPSRSEFWNKARQALEKING